MRYYMFGIWIFLDIFVIKIYIYVYYNLFSFIYVCYVDLLGVLLCIMVYLVICKFVLNFFLIILIVICLCFICMIWLKYENVCFFKFKWYY